MILLNKNIMNDNKIFCVYLTTYFGNKLPQFYIGSTSVIKIYAGYHGTVTSKKYKNMWEYEIKNNKHLFKTKIISLHITRKEAYIKEEYFQRKLNVISSNLYINLSYANGGFVAEYGKKLSDEWKNNIGKAMIGKKHTLETKMKQSISGGHRKGKKNTIEENKKNSESNKKVIKTPEWNKKNSEANIGRIHIINIITKQRKFLKPDQAKILFDSYPDIWIKMFNKK